MQFDDNSKERSERWYAVETRAMKSIAVGSPRHPIQLFEVDMHRDGNDHPTMLATAAARSARAAARERIQGAP